jgi:hypothetical protein
MPQDSLPEFMREERDAIVAEIYAAWKGVNRKEGVSWSETCVLDDWGTIQERLAARESDSEWSWEELVSSTEWPGRYGASFSFLDAIGFRYYLAPALSRALQDQDETSVCFHLTLDSGDLREHCLAKWSLLSDRQRVCIARAIRFMKDAIRATSVHWAAEDWRKAYDSHWVAFDVDK